MLSDHQLKQVLVVGAGVAGTRAAETLRQEGFDGALTIVGAERHAPYHRPPLSKKLLTGKVQRAGVDLAPQLDLDARVLRGASVRGIDMSSRTVQVFDEGRHEELGFDGLVIATGAVPREWPGGPVPDGVLVLRTVDDCLAIRDRLDAAQSCGGRRRGFHRCGGRGELPFAGTGRGARGVGGRPVACSAG